MNKELGLTIGKISLTIRVMLSVIQIKVVFLTKLMDFVFNLSYNISRVFA